jgi:AraC-like DNA-binding protein
LDDLDSLLRGAAIGISLLLGAAYWQRRPRSDLAWSGSLYATGLIAYLLLGHPGFAAWRPLVRLGIGMVALAAPFFFWAQARLIFDDGFRLRPRHFCWLALIEASGVLRFVLPVGSGFAVRAALDLGLRLAFLALVGQALFAVWRWRAADLVETRARLRLALVFTTGIASACAIVAALLYGPMPSWPASVRLVEAAAILLLNLGFGVALMRFGDDFLSMPRRASLATARLARESGAGPASALPDADTLALARLEALMSGEETWRETGLTIAALATRLGIPEYRLRRLINQRLGFRNFTAFVNEYRLAAAASRLADQAQARLPVLTIALDLGWGSIGPFNRAFRARFGVPPSDYRRQRMQSPSDQTPAIADS